MRAEHLYVHVPFCARRCVYCDFSIAVRAEVPDAEYLDALTAELRLRRDNADVELATLYFGGGTPSKLAPDSIRTMMSIIRGTARFGREAEVTLEANPEDVDERSVTAWVDAGINRVSLGVQSFQPHVLTWMHRTHTAQQAERAVQVLRNGGIENISVDLIFAVPAVLGRSWDEDLARALELGIPHVSVYGLTVESHTPLGRWVSRHDAAEATEESFEAEFLHGSAALTAAGYHHYEVSNYAREGMESRHNSAYWGRRPYKGFGPSAHEFDGERRRWNTAPYAAWVRHLRAGRDPVEGSETLSWEQVQAEEVYLGLRTSSGLALSVEELAYVQPWIEAGWAQQIADGHIRLTAAGWLRLDALSADLTHLRSRY